MTLFEERVIATLAQIYGRTRMPVRTTALVVHLDLAERTARGYLAHLERRGVVQRVGLRGGWLPASRVVA